MPELKWDNLMLVWGMAMAVLLIVFMIFLSGCAPLWIAFGVETEHNQFCMRQPHDPSCRH